MQRQLAKKHVEHPGHVQRMQARASTVRLNRGARVGLVIMVGIVGLGVAGMIFQQIATALDLRKYPAPGRMVNVGGHHLHLQIAGHDRTGPTVILDAGLMSSSIQWTWVQREVGQWARVISYDRAGLGWSERSAYPRDGEQIARELHAALKRAEIDGPYVLVGHSLGGLFMRIFAGMYPEEVAGMVLVDAVHPDQIQQQTLGRQYYEGFGQWLGRQVLLSRFGMQRVVDRSASPSPDLPAQQQAEARSLLFSSRHLAATLDEWRAWDEASSSQAATVRTIGDKPLIILTAGLYDQERADWAALQHDLSLLSPQSVHRVIDGATHDGIITKPDYAKAVTTAIREVHEATFQ